ncbi:MULTISPECIES: outer membrane lipoprotein-sorting protein [unclassified Lentimicrobium]|uniref:outer membrane lipoprotein-sorting protein n=1 Tax=unclassified Lentimicrobium TaxID=2677434 RepID=UPI0015574DF7|nr:MULTISPECIES: outer membrane lipoprotein-sorting protein [unclassified Lentimicrobium]NPD44063.1 outer membrane lipoprotein-sorting protein [Lentimicrobium sp. S6]NPD85915.1 outer membrane lipoprotein-sorting protein [Lentimicrobium sp. L6]
MKNIITITLILIGIGAFAQETPDAKTIIDKVDFNMSSDTKITKSQMVVYGRRNSRTLESISYTKGHEESYTEYLAPEREKGTKMLKLEDRLWIYTPSTDRTIQLSGHMLRQSVMGSDMSYEDMMEDRKLLDIYEAEVIGEEDINGKSCWVLELHAKVDDASYQSRKIWIEKEHFVPLKEELFAKSGQLLKKTEMSDVRPVDGRWYPHKINYKDMLKDGKGTDFIILEVQIDAEIPAHILSKAALRK